MVGESAMMMRAKEDGQKWLLNEKLCLIDARGNYGIESSLVSHEVERQNKFYHAFIYQVFRLHQLYFCML